MYKKSKDNIIKSLTKSIQSELLAWARTPAEKKFIIAFSFIILSLITSSFTPAFSSALNVWGVIIFFEAIFQKNIKWNKWDGRKIFKTYLLSGIIGTLAATFLLLYFDVFYFFKLSVVDFFTRYVWFLLPLSKLPPKQRGR